MNVAGVGASIYRGLLHVLPTALREAHGGEMLELFAEHVEQARRRSPAAAVAACLAAYADLLRRAPYEHLRRRGRYTIREPRMSFFAADVRFALRTFSRQPGATALVILTLALAVAANTAVFAIVDAVFFRALPYPEAARLVDIDEQAPSWGLDFTGINYPDFAAWRDDARAFEGMSAWGNASFNLSDGATTARVDGQEVTYDMARVLGVHPVLGRAFTRDEDVPNGPNVVMIGYSLWQSTFAGSRDVIGKTIRLNSLPYTIVGVLPPSVTLSGPTALWVPLRGDPKEPHQNYSYEGIGRLKPGVSLAQARKDLLMAQEPIWRQHDTARVVSPRVMALRDRFVADYRTIGAALGASVVLVLLIACANVAGAMLARSIFRRRELGIRAALGASTGRLTRQLLTESLVLATIGGIVGTALGRVGITLLVRGLEAPPPWLHIDFDARAMGFSLLIVLATTLLFGLLPALQARRHDASGTLAIGSSRTSASLPERRLLDALVVVEIALAAVLLASGGLLLRAYGNLRDVDPGFRPDGVASIRVALPRSKYRDWPAQRRFYETLIDRIRALPGVTDAGAVSCPPFGCHWGRFYRADGAPAKPSGAADPVVLTRIATPDYLATMGIRLLRGRSYAENEGAPNGPRPVVINDILEKQLWPDGASAVGKRFHSLGDTTAAGTMTVVGVVKDARHYGLATPMRSGLYMPLTIFDSASNFASFAVLAHTTGDASSLFAPMRAAVRELDPELAVFDTKTMRAALDQSLASRRMIALCLVVFAAIALTLSIGGIYAVLTYVVGRRRQEIGIRIALGAPRTQVLRLVVRQGMRLVALGLLIGLPTALIAARALASLLVGVTARDPVAFACAGLVLAFTGVIAALVPARRAAGVDPKIVLAEST